MIELEIDSIRVNLRNYQRVVVLHEKGTVWIAMRARNKFDLDTYLDKLGVGPPCLSRG